MKYDIGTILSITHDNLLTRIDNVYQILNYMTDDNLFTHVLPRACRFCKPFILKQHPQLLEWDIYKPQVNTNNWEEMLEKARIMFGDELDIEKAPSGVWSEKNPIEELSEMVDKDKIIEVVLPPKEEA